MDMRSYIDLFEAKPKMVVSKNMTVEYQSLYDKAKVLSGNYLIPVIVDRWGKEWVNAVHAEFNRLKKNHYDYEQSEKEYHESDEENKTPYVFNKFDAKYALDDALANWWQKNGGNIIDDAKSALKHVENQYFEYHSDVEASDPITLFEAEKRLVNDLWLNGFSSIENMNSFLVSLDSFLTTSFTASSDMSWGECTKECADIISNGIPLILWFCKSMMSFEK